MAGQIALLTLFFLVGLAVQRSPWAPVLRGRTWTTYFWTVTPVLVFTAFSTIHFDRQLGLALAAAVLASWLVVAIAYGYARFVAAERGERAALALGAGFANTGFVGYPLAHIAFGSPGLALMVLYDRLSWLVPATAVSTTIARLHGRNAGTARPGRATFMNPPLLAALAAVSLRVGGLDLGASVAPLGHVAAAIVGPAGFFLLGLAIPLEPVVHGAGELRRAAGALAIRFVVSPLVLLLCGLVLGTSIPAPFYLGAAMPCAFHLLVLARVFDLRPALMRLLVVGSTVPAVAAVIAVTAFVR